MRFRNLYIVTIILITSINSVTFSQIHFKQTDSITNNTIDKYKIFCGLTSTSIPIEGSKPTVTGSIIQYRWIKSLDTLSGIWNLTPPSDTLSYLVPTNPGSYTVKNFYKRIVFNNGSHDTSNVCVVEVIPGSTDLSPNTVSPNTQSVHYGQIPITFNGSPISGGSISSLDTLKYVWIKSQDPGFGIAYYATEGSFQSQNLTFSEGADTTFYYDRFIYVLHEQKLTCVTPSNVVKIILADTNIISCADTVLCYSTDAPVITGNSQNTYLYQWQKFNGTFFADIPGATNFEYFPGILFDTTKYRRFVKDTINGYTSYSNVITINITSVIQSNNIANATTQPICAGQSGATIGGLNPTGGNSSYQYSWWYSSDQINWTLFTGFSQITGFISHALYNTTYFKRIIQSGGCTSTSNIVAVSPIIVNATADTLIETCGNVATLSATPPLTGESGWWEVPQAITLSPDSTFATTTATIAPLTIYQQSATFPVIWHVKNNASGCKNSVPVVVKFYHTISPANAGADITLIEVDSVILNATPPGSGMGNWSVVSGGGLFVYNNDAHTYAKNILQGENIFRWTITNGPCTPEYDDVKITVTNIKIPEGFSPNFDGLNDFFEIKGVEFYPKSEFTIFNRWGTEVYSKIGYDNSWDGKSMNNKVLPEDTYFYVLKLDEKNSRKGYIILKR